MILVKMGKKSDLLKHLSSNKFFKRKTASKESDQKSNTHVFFEMINKEKIELLQYINNLSKNAISISVANAYNLSLLCKKYEFYSQGIQVLQKILLKNELPHLFRWKSLILLSQLYDSL
jgi:hypothetical protein